MPLDLSVDTAEVFLPLHESEARYKGCKGGRGSGKSHERAEALTVDAVAWPGEMGGEGLRALCCREYQKSLKQSAKKLVEMKLQKFGLGEAQGFKVFRDVIQTPGDGVILFEGLRDHTADSLKSLEGLHRAWIEEAQTITAHSLTLLRPSVRGRRSEIWATWNPRLPSDAIEGLFVGPQRMPGSVCVTANWNHNPWFPEVLEEERQADKLLRPTLYPHIWEGEYALVLEGAYYADHLVRAKEEGRIGYVPREALNKVYAFFDLASTSDKADAVAIWIVQFIGAEIRLLDYHEAVGQEFSYHVNWLRSRGWGDAFCVLPHDGAKHDVIFAVTPEAYLRKAGFGVAVVPNQGRGAAMSRVTALRDVFPRIRFNSGLRDLEDPEDTREDPTKAGRDALGWYHSRLDEKRRIDLGPEHDWSSHCADAAGLIAVWAQMNPTRTAPRNPRLARTNGMTA